MFYPAFRDRADRDGVQTYAEAMEEHRAVENTVIADVQAAELATPEFAGRVKVFGEFVDHHASEEERTMFKMARRLFSAAERAQPMKITRHGDSPKPLRVPSQAKRQNGSVTRRPSAVALGFIKLNEKAADFDHRGRWFAGGRRPERRPACASSPLRWTR